MSLILYRFTKIHYYQLEDLSPVVKIEIKIIIYYNIKLCTIPDFNLLYNF